MVGSVGLGCLCGFSPLGIAAESLPVRQNAAAARGGSGAVRDLTFDALKFAMDKGDPFQRSLLGSEIERLEGSSIRIRGYMLPTYQTSGITRFVLVRDNLECCFGPGAALYDCIVVNMEAGKSAKFTTKPILVEGTFSIKEWLGPEGDVQKPLAIYALQARVAK